ncbi:amino acid adenylation domain-containing protein [Longispora sp. K20-0274]
MVTKDAALGFSCVLVGGTALLVECGRLIADRGGRVLAVVPADATARRWAADRGIPVVELGPGLAGRLGEWSVDYLFSVANLRMLPEPVLGLARELPVNFHDALLPADAGLHATCWAVWRGVRRHGVTWHVMTAGADEGDILAQRAVDVEPDETALSLNLKCLRAGIDSFAELLDGLCAGRLRRVRQDLGARTYHGLADRPAAGLCVSWRWSAEQVCAAARACDFGGQPNAFGVPKVWTGSGYLLVREAAPASGGSGAAPGTVVATGGDTVTVATGSGAVRLRLATLTGEAPSWRARSGDRLPELEPDRAEALEAACRAAAGQEAYWVRRLTDLSALDVPHRSVAGTGHGQAADLPIAVPAGMDEMAVGAAALAYLVRLAGRAGEAGLRVADPAEAGLFAEVVPVSVPAVSGDFVAYRAEVADRINRARGRGPLLRDVVTRYPALADGVDLPVVVSFDADLPTRAALVVQVAESSCRFLADPAALPDAEARELTEGFEAFLADLAVGASPARATLLSPDQTARITRWNDTAMDHPYDERVPELFAAQARRRPHSPAVVCAGRTLTYAEVDERSEALAGTLAARGVGPGALVGVYLPRGADLVVALLAVLRAGAAYVPLDPLYPRERIAAMLADARTAIVLTHGALLTDLPDGRAALALDHLIHPRDRRVPVEVDPARADDLAYVIYTSGSTGRPKGVEVTHRGLTNFLRSMAAAPGLAEGDRMLAVTTVCFDIAALELFGPLITGGTVELVPAELAADGAALAAHLADVRPTVMQATPATWKMLLAAGWTGDPGLRVYCGGEALPPALAERLLDRAGEVWNLYGPTETTVWSTVSRLRRGRPVTIGRPVANTTCHVLDAELRPVPPGVPGELWIGGAGLARGYRDQPELAADRFRDTDHGRLYGTGDLARWTSGGELDHLGRLDHQVKIRGYRIELGEIESALLAHPDVAQSAVITRPDGHGEPRLLAYLTPTPGARPDPVALRAHLAHTLPDYMLPTVFTVLAALPLTPNGKLDRQALPEPAAAPGRAPRTTREAQLCQLYAEALDIDAVGADDDFAILGGTSLTATRLAARAREVGLRLTAREILAHPTPAALAAHLDTPTAVSPQPDLAGEIALAADVTPSVPVITTVAEPRLLLLTGATGFLGAYLLRELLHRTGARVVCLVRGHSDDHARRRLHATLRAYDLDCDLDRISVRRGDLAEPDLGLPTEEFDRLSRGVDAVFHAGAVVNWLHPYARLRTANVTGTETVLRLAARHRTVPVHHVSSMGVFAHRSPDAPATPSAPPPARPRGCSPATSRPNGSPKRISPWPANAACRSASTGWPGSAETSTPARARPTTYCGASSPAASASAPYPPTPAPTTTSSPSTTSPPPSSHSRTGLRAARTTSPTPGSPASPPSSNACAPPAGPSPRSTPPNGPTSSTPTPTTLPNRSPTPSSPPPTTGISPRCPCTRTPRASTAHRSPTRPWTPTSRTSPVQGGCPTPGRVLVQRAPGGDGLGSSPLARGH